MRLIDDSREVLLFGQGGRGRPTFWRLNIDHAASKKIMDYSNHFVMAITSAEVKV